MIVKDEADLIGQAISSVLPIVSEVIVVDTGSSDNTIEVAKSLGAKVFHERWNDDFSTPRNLSISKAKSDWILVLDADEAIASRDLKALFEMTRDPSICYEFVQRHYTNDHRLSDYTSVRGEYPEWEREHQGYFSSALVRFFPNHAGLKYQGRVHELVEPSITEGKRHKIVRSSIPIHHYGHTEEVLKRKNKHGLYGSLGKAKLNDNPTDWKGFYELGVEYNKPEKREESVLAFKRSIALNPNYLPTWTNLGYVLTELGRYEEAISALSTALKIDPNAHEAHCNLGVAYLRTKQIALAEHHFRAAIKLNQNYLNAYFNLSHALASVGRLSEAAHSLKRLIGRAPNNSRARADLGALYMMVGDKVRAEALLSGSSEEDQELTQSN